MATKGLRDGCYSTEVHVGPSAKLVARRKEGFVDHTQVTNLILDKKETERAGETPSFLLCLYLGATCGALVPRAQPRFCDLLCYIYQP